MSDSESGTIKLLVYVSLPTLFASNMLKGHNILFAFSFIAGAVLQALVPPRMFNFWKILLISTVGTVVVLIWKP